MRMYDIIQKKKNGDVLSAEEIRYFVDGFTRGDIPDYQAAALLMAICLKGFNHGETAALTTAIAGSGDMLDLSGIRGIKVDKHSTGGVGDKTSLVTLPIAAACGVPVAKMSGRGLGHTGGTIDKLESIPGFRTDITGAEFINQVNSMGICVAGQSANLAPADKKLYALRDLTATVDNMGLIAASIMSKKLAAGADCILLDVKMGSGAFMKGFDQAAALAEMMVSAGIAVGRRTAALITDMDAPLGRAVGNALEVVEAIETLNGGGPEDLRELSLNLARNMLFLAGIGDLDECGRMAENAIEEKRALGAFRDMTAAQGGDVRYIDDPGLFPATHGREILSPRTGYIAHMDCEEIGAVSCMLGAGRITKNDDIDHSAGILLRRKRGEYTEQGEVIAVLYGKDSCTDEAAARYMSAISFASAPPRPTPLIRGRVTENGVERFKCI